MRANSVSTLFYYGKNLKKDLENVENIYRKNSLPIIFQLADNYQPANLYEFLIKNGYKEIDETIVMSASIEDIVDILINSSFNYISSETILDKWIEAFKSIRSENIARIEGIKKILKRLTAPKPCFYIVEDKKPIAVGLTVTEKEFMVIYNMYTHPDYRRQGIAKTILAKMTERGKVKGVKYIYLQVEEDNIEAINLYLKIGMKEIYKYRYLIKWINLQKLILW